MSKHGPGHVGEVTTELCNKCADNKAPAINIITITTSLYDYSDNARNNAEAYPEPCREFTLKESFWFALTSFTPQVHL